MRLRVNPITRRVFLGGAGVALALPALRSLAPRRARAAGADGAPLRLIALYVPDGIHMADWTPAAEGALGTEVALPSILQPLEPVASKLLVVSGLENRPGYPDEIGDHASG